MGHIVYSAPRWIVDCANYHLESRRKRRGRGGDKEKSRTRRRRGRRRKRRRRWGRGVETGRGGGGGLRWLWGGGRYSCWVLQYRKINYCRTGKLHTETKVLRIWKRPASVLNSWARKALGLGLQYTCHSRLPANQGLQENHPIRRRGGFFRVICLVLQIHLHCGVALNGWCDLLWPLLLGALAECLRAIESHHGKHGNTAPKGREQWSEKQESW